MSVHLAIQMHSSAWIRTTAKTSEVDRGKQAACAHIERNKHDKQAFHKKSSATCLYAMSCADTAEYTTRETKQTVS